jgi:hypothetical protein
MKNNGEAVDMGQEVRKARKQIEDEERERRRAEREAREQAERAEAARRSKIKTEVKYTAIEVQQGTGARIHHATGTRRGPVMIFGKHKGVPFSEIPSGYLRSMADGEWCKTTWLKETASRELDRRSGGGGNNSSRMLTTNIDDVNAELLHTW